MTVLSPKRGAAAPTGNHCEYPCVATNALLGGRGEGEEESGRERTLQPSVSSPVHQLG